MVNLPKKYNSIQLFFLVSKFGPIKVELLRGLLDWAGEAKAILVGWDWGAGAPNPQHEESK